MSARGRRALIAFVVFDRDDSVFNDGGFRDFMPSRKLFTIIFAISLVWRLTGVP
jgi:hypothetical protein